MDIRSPKKDKFTQDECRKKRTKKESGERPLYYAKASGERINCRLQFGVTFR